MRISDWSSDVCSSDVFHDADRERLWALTQAKLADRGFAQPQRPIRRIGRWLPYVAALLLGVVAAAWFFFDDQPQRTLGARKRVVSGKSVSVRVVPGGRGIIKQKNKETNNMRP